MMKLKRCLCMLLMCAIATGCLSVPARAEEFTNEGVIRLEDLAWEWVDLSEIECSGKDGVLLTTDSINISVPKNSIRAVNQPVSLQAGDSVTINCSYSPSPASVDFGLLTSDGKFYSINVKGGSIDQTFEISQSGSYTVAIRNNTSQTISVVGFVDY